MVPVNGVPMVERVVKAVAQTPEIGAICVVAHEPDEIAAQPLIADLVQKGRLTFAPGQFNIVDSVFAAAESAQFPLLITTADNCLVAELS